MARDDITENVRELYAWVAKSLENIVWAEKQDDEWIFQDHAKGRASAYSQVKRRMEKFFRNIIDIKELPGGNNGKV